MPAILVTILSLFARPIGQLLTQGLTAGSVAFVAWATTKGLPVTSAENLAAGFVGAISAIISTLAASQGVTIPVINADTNNGVRVVSSDAAKKAGLQKQDAPIPK